jgi:hypothetical protein
MAQVAIYDCEFLTAPGGPTRFWCGPQDLDALCVQIGAVQLSLDDGFDISAREGWMVQPTDSDGRIVPIDPPLTRLTSITDALLQDEAQPLVDALSELKTYADGALLLSWGKDDLLTPAASLFVQNQLSPRPAGQFRDATPILMAVGETPETICGLRSNTICGHYGLEQHGPAQDACADAEGVAVALQFLLRAGRLAPADFTGLAPE